MHALTNLLLPRRCPCGQAAHESTHLAGAAVCRGCRAMLLGCPAQPVRPHPRPRGLPPCFTAAPYAGGVRRCLITYKERGRRTLAPVLALALVKTLQEAFPAAGGGDRDAAGEAPVLLVPVPPSRVALRARGFDHVALLVQWTLRLLPPELAGICDWAPLLCTTRRVADQAGLPAAARARNVAGSLAARGGAGRGAAGGAPRVVLVDDVMTSGSTLAEAARALRAGGLQTHKAVVVAAVLRPERRSPSALPSRGRSG